MKNNCPKCGKFMKTSSTAIYVFSTCSSCGTQIRWDDKRIENKKDYHDNYLFDDDTWDSKVRKANSELKRKHEHY